VQLTLRPYATAGVALTAAGVIALAPVAPPPPAIQISAPRIASEAVQLATYPLDLTTVYGDLITNTINSLIGDPTAASSADSLVGLLFPGILPVGTGVTPKLLPIIQQLFTNLGSYFAAVVNDPIAVVLNELSTTSLPALVDAVTELVGGNFSGALQSLGTAVSAPVIAGVEEFVNGVIAIPTSIVTHLTKLITGIPTWAQTALTGIVGVPVAAFDGAQQAVENVVQAIAADDAVGVLTALVAAPGVFLNEVLNANDGTTVGTAQGLLSTNGPIGALLQIRNGIATALDGPFSSTPGSSSSSQGLSSSTQAAVEATPTAAANTVTLNVAPTTGDSAPATGGSAPAMSKTTTTTTLNTNVVAPNGHKDTAVTPPLRTTTTGTSGINASPTTTPNAHLPTTLKTVTAPLNTTLKTVAGLGAAQRGGKTSKK